MIDYKHYIEDIQYKINLLLFDYISFKNCKVGKKVVEAMSYSLMAGGKRIRPALCISANKLVGGENVDLVMPLACAIEMIHTYSLIHDDLPAMDNDTLRRGKLTCHKRFDEATAILAGDALLTLAFEILAELGFNSSAVFSNRIFRIIRKISIASGFRGMIGGQMRDINSEGFILSQDQLKSMHVLKTGMLIEAAVISGAIIGCANNFQIKQLKIYAYKLGLAFQVRDDILNVIGETSNIGKPVGTDSLRVKNTYVSLLGLVEAKKIARDLINNALVALKMFDKKADPLRVIACRVLERNM